MWGIRKVFKQKTDTTFSTVISPKKKQEKRKAEKSDIQRQGEAFFIKPNFEKNKTLRALSGDNLIVDYLKDYFHLNDQYSFEIVSEKSDDLGFNHITYKVLFAGVSVDESLILVHSQKGQVKFINGHIANDVELNTDPNISKTEASSLAKNLLEVSDLINENDAELTIIKIAGEYKLAYKVRIASLKPLKNYDVFIDANTGALCKKVNQVAHDDEIGTGDTYYSGSQTFTTDKFSGGYRLRDNGRKIETYDATNETPVDYVNVDNIWEGYPFISSFTISNTNQDWWYSIFSDTEADFYLILKDGDNLPVFKTPIKKNVSTPVNFEINQYLTNPPYSMEIWDDDVVSDDFGGSYSISITNGLHNWSGDGNNGSYEIESIGHPAIDVHWGMQVSYDFYKDLLGRESYDGKGSVIKQYINPPSLQGGEKANNAGAYNDPVNIMVYGLGDGKKMNPVVGLDVEGHEYTHMVVNHNGNGGLVYEGESGALNESFADIMGTAIEFYSGVDPDWSIGEGITIDKPFLRSMSNPKLAGQPDTYKKENWANTFDLSFDHGGVHVNSGVQNYWFYLLSEGGSGTNDLGNSYSVTSIGITDAIKIAYRNLITYLTPNATYYDAYLGSLQAAEDLFGNPSIQYSAVREAWYAVGIGNDPNNFCSGTTELTEISGSFSDGSGAADYGVNANCKWVIAPPGATRISLDFISFDTENEFDTVFVYDGPDETYPVLMEWYGSTLPPTINTTDGVGAMCVVFKSDASITAEGWSANYSSTTNIPTCTGGTLLTDATGVFDDGSSVGNYTNNLLCHWMIAPPCAESVTLNFLSFDTEKDYDGVIILDGFGDDANIIDVISGTALPSPVISTTGEMLVIFYSDYANVGDGFEAYYTSTGAAICSGTTNLNSTDYGYFDDGSGAGNYCNNLNCHWLIQPPEATSITLEFSEFELESASSDGISIFDAVEVYDGVDTTADLLGRFYGSSIPESVTSSGGNMLVRFHTDMAETYKGWSAFYYSNSPNYCEEINVLTESSGEISDGSDANSYANNTYCSWLIEPTDADNITLTFSEFNTETDYDGVVVYDGSDNSAPKLGEFSGSDIPSPVVSTGGSMFVEFLSDPALRSGGFTASYNSIVTGSNNVFVSNDLKVYPNPNNGIFFVENLKNESLNVEILDIQGKLVWKEIGLEKGLTELQLSYLKSGIYALKISSSTQQRTIKIIIGK